MDPETGQLDWPALEARPGPQAAAARDRRGVERAGDDQRRRPGGRAGPRRRSAGLRRCGPLRPAPPGRCPGHGLRLPGLLGLQVLRAARRACCTGGHDLLGGVDVPKLEPAPETRAGAAGDRHAEPRGDRRRGGGRGVPGLARFRRRPAGTRLRARLGRAAPAGPGAGRAAAGAGSPRSTACGLRAARLRGPHADGRVHRAATCLPTTSPTRWPRRRSSSPPATSTPRRSSSGCGLASRGGLVRAGCACYTTAEEVDRLLEGVARRAADRRT